MTSTHTLELPGARLRYQVRGAGTLLLVMGAPIAASAMAPLADALASDHKVVTHDPRGIAGRTLGDLEPNATPERRADDVVALLDALGAQSADVFGTGDGAVTGLAMVTRHPGRVRTLVAHEPPLVELFPDAGARAEIDDVVETCRRGGPEVAWEKFVASSLFDAEDTLPRQSSQQDLADGERFSGHGLESTTSYVPDVSALIASRSRVVVGIGVASRDLTVYRTSTALAKLLGTPPVKFSGDHRGFLDQPLDFADTLRKVLTGEGVRKLRADPRRPRLPPNGRARNSMRVIHAAR